MAFLVRGLLGIGLVCLLAGSSSLAFQTRALSVNDGVYTEEQATRGRTVYDKECAGCHLDTLQGDGLAPGLVADSFTYRWQDGPVSDLFIVIKATMPADRPSALQDQEYADIIAYLLKKNNYPSGSTELSKNQADLKGIGFKKANDK